MPDNLNDPGPQDSKLIALEQEHEVRYWTERLGITEGELRAAVAEVGHSAAAVRAHLDSVVTDSEAETLGYDQLTDEEKASLDE